MSDFAMVLFRYFPQGGLQTDFLRVLAECTRRGHPVTVFCGDWEKEAAFPPGARLEMLPCTGSSNALRAIRFQRHFMTRLETCRFDLILGFNKMAGLDLYFAADSCFAAEHDDFFSRVCNPRCRIFRAMEREIFAPDSRTKILALTERQKEEYRKIYRTPEERFLIVPPGVSPACRRPAGTEKTGAARKKIREEFHLPEDAVLLLEIGSSFRTKGVDRNLRAWRKLPANVHLLVAGREKHRTYEKLARSLGVEDRVHFAGPRNDVPELLFAADALVHPARKEAAGNVLAEALAAGIPVVCTAACGYAPLVQKAGGLVLPEPFVQEAWERMLEKLLSSLPERKKQAEKSSSETDLYRRAEIIVDEMERMCRK